jgi:hypothetical protein
MADEAKKPARKQVQRNPADEAERAKVTSLSTINKMISGIQRSAVKLNETIHATALLCVQHAKDYGDASPAARLVDALPTSHRRSLVINWFGQFSPITIGKDGKTDKMKAHLRGNAEEREKMWMIAEAKATPFYAMPEAEREPDVPTYEGIHNNILSFIKRQETRVEKIENEDEKQKAAAEVAALKKAVGAN